MAVIAAEPAAAEPCKLGRAGELPVTMEGTRPLVHAAINGNDALFLADSGAFFSTLTFAGARQFDLSLTPTAPGFYLQGVGGNARTWLTTVKTFTIFNMNLPKVPFLVADNDLGHGAVGVLGQNVFRLGDVDYDLANGVIAILRTQGDCRKAGLAYWANAKGMPFSMMDIDFATRERPHTTGYAYVNGSKIRVLFDTGAGASMLSLDAAKQAGITPDSPGVTAAGSMSGYGRRTVRTWIAPFTSFRIGDEEIRNTHLRIGDVELMGTQMLIGADFFLSHHVLVASSQHRLYFTYNGGPVFNLTTTPVAPPTPASAGTDAAGNGAAGGAAPADTPDAATRPALEGGLDAAGYARRGSASVSRREYQPALADLSKAIELDPAQPDYFYERGRAYWANNQADKALEDFGQAIKLKSDDVPALMARAELHARRNDPADTIRPDLDAADRAAPKAGDMRLTLGGLYERVRNYSAAIAQYDDWISSHNSDDIQMPRARNGRCWVRAISDRDLDKALDDCNFAVHSNSKAAAFRDSRGLVYLRQGKYEKAIADYDAALAVSPKIAWSLYGRGLAKQRLGQSAAGDADIVAAKALFPKIAEEAASHGIDQGSK
jgi:tetratricopeptide (TPR) repeat protein/predicted aspartyl protease